MGFFDDQQKKMAVRLLGWRYQKMGLPVPDSETLDQQAGKVIDDARRIARKSGRNVVSIIKDMIADLKKG